MTIFGKKNSASIGGQPATAGYRIMALVVAGFLLSPAGAFAQGHTSNADEGFQIGDLALNVYGFVQADMIYDFDRVDPDWNDTLRVTTIPTRGEPYGNDGEVVFGVRQTRIGFETNYNTDVGPVKALLEWEFFGTGGDAGQTTPRLRHAWLEWENLGMGQTWSNFMDGSVFPNTVDYWGPTGMVFYRNQQLRYTFPLANDNEFAVALEDPGTALTVGRFRDESVCSIPGTPEGNCASTINEVFQAHNDLPDLTLRYRNENDWGHWQIAGIVRKLGYERLDTGEDNDETGYGINASTAFNTVGRDQVKLQVAYGDGIGNYFNDGGLDLAPDNADIDLAGANAVTILGVMAYYDRYWNDKWSSSIGWSMTDLDTEAGQAGEEFETGQIATLNLLHYPTDRVLLGLEMSWGKREDIDGETGTDFRVQFTFKVNWALANLKNAVN